MMIKSYIKCILLCLSFTVVGCRDSTLSGNASYDAGMEAFERKDYGIALYDLEPRARRGESNAQFHVGLIYLHGQDKVSKNIAKARHFFRLAADQETLRRCVSARFIGAKID